MDTKMSYYVYFFMYVQVIADRDYGPGEEVRFWEFFFYLFICFSFTGLCKSR